MTETLSAKEAARELGIDARTFRKFMRAILDKEDQPGQGNRYHIEAKQIKKLKKQYAEWQSPRPKAEEANGDGGKPKAKKNKTPKVDPDEAIEMVTDDDLTLEDLEGPSDEELTEIEV